MKILITGGAGFLGFHLCSRLLEEGHSVIVLDNLYTNNIENIKYFSTNKNFTFIEHDVINPYHFEVDQIYNLASPVAPMDYRFRPKITIESNVLGAVHAVNLARELGIFLFQFSTIKLNNINISASYSDYYIEGKYLAEEICSQYKKAKIARLYSTVGPRMNFLDKRVVPAFNLRAKDNNQILIPKNNIDKFCYVDDIIFDIVKFMNSARFGCEIIGNPIEVSILNIAKVIVKYTNSKSKIYVEGQLSSSDLDVSPALERIYKKLFVRKDMI